MKRCLLLMLTLAMPRWLPAQTTTAADYFNQGASTFIREDQQKALAIVNEGLELHPQDEQLLKLKALLEKQNEQQQQQQNQENEENQDQNQSEQQNQQNQQDQSEPSDEEKDSESSGEEKKEEQPPPEEPEEQPQAGDMTGEEAEMVLDSFRQLEEAQRNQLMQEMIRRKMSEMPPVEKDW